MPDPYLSVLRAILTRVAKRRKEFDQLTSRISKETIDVLQNHAARFGDKPIKMVQVRDQVVMMGDDPAYWRGVQAKLKADARLTTVVMIEDGEGEELFAFIFR